VIARIFRVRIRPEQRTDFERRFLEDSVPMVKSNSGLVSVSVGKPTKWVPNGYVMVSIWENETSIEAFAGKDWNRPVIPSNMEKFVVECWVHHYEIFGNA